MKTLHSLNKGLMQIIVFAQSPAGMVFGLLFAFLVDLVTNGLSTQFVFGKRIAQTGEQIGISSVQSYVASGLFALLASAMLGLAAMVCAFHGLRTKQLLISTFSFLISLAGVELSIYEGATGNGLGGAWGVFIFVSTQVLAVSLAVVPQIVYDAMAKKLEGDFGVQIKRFIEGMNNELKKSFDANMKVLGEADEEKVAKRHKKARKKANTPRTQEPATVGTGSDIDALLNRYAPKDN